MITDPLDLELARQIRALPTTVEPERDLWPGVERRLLDERRPWQRMPWANIGVAASLLLACAALLVALERSVVPGAAPARLADAPVQAPGGSTFATLQAEFQRARSPLVSAFSETNKTLDEETLVDLQRNIEIMESARREIERRVREDPDNRRLVELLMHLHAQELDLLRRDFTLDGRAM